MMMSMTAKNSDFCAEMVALALLKVKEEEAWKIAKLNNQRFGNRSKPF